MPLGKGWHWCPNCNSKGVMFDRITIINKEKYFKCVNCGKRFKTEEIKGV